MPAPEAPELLTQAQVEHQIMRLSDELAFETVRYDTISRDAAVAESNYKHQQARATIAIANSSDRSVTVATREALAHEWQLADGSTVADLYHLWKIKAASEGASKQTLSALRTRLDALRTLAANIRAQT